MLHNDKSAIHFMRKVIVVGATSGIGRELCRQYAGAGYFVGATGRRQDLLYTLQLEFPNQLVTECFDVTADDAANHLEFLVEKLGGLDLLIYNSGYGETSLTVDWQIDKRTVDTNVNGFIKAVNFAYHYFEAQGHGHIASTSSIASLRGNPMAPAYSASKAFQSVYLEGLYMKNAKVMNGIAITDIQPGFVNTKMAKGNRRFWVSSAAKAASQIFDAIEKKKWRVYITRRWWVVAKLLKWMPDFIYHRVV